MAGSHGAVVGFALALTACANAQGVEARNAAHAEDERALERAAEQRLIDTIVAERVRRRLPPAEILHDVAVLEVAVEAVRQGRTPQEAFKFAARRMASGEQNDVTITFFETDNLEQLPLPPFFELEDLSMALVIVRTAPKTSPRARYGVCYFLLDEPSYRPGYGEE